MAIRYASEFVWGSDEFSLSEELLESDELGPAADDSVGQGISDKDEDGAPPRMNNNNKRSAKA